MAESPHVGGVGIVFTFTVKDTANAAIDLSSSATKTLTVVAPNGVSTTWTLAYVTDGTDGQVKFTTTATTDLHTAGKWRAQLWMDFTTTSWYTDIVTFEIEANL